MKAKLEYCLRWLREGAVRVVRSYPVETLLALYACIRCLLTYELDWSEEELFNRLGLVPLFFALALAVNNLAGRGPWRKVYWVVWAPIVPLTLWSGLGDWIESASFRISLGILAPLLLLLSLRAVRNDRFVNGALVWLRSGALALLFANVALGLFYAILYSATYIFGLDGAWIEHVAVWAVTICETLADTVYKKEYRKLYESLDYIRRDSAAFARFGVKDLDDLAAIFPEAMRDYVRWGYDWSCVDTCVDTNIIELEAPVNVRFEVNAEYPHYYTNLRNWYNDHSYDVSNDTLRLFLGEECAVYRISCRDLLERQLERSGFDPAEACEPAPEQLLRLLDYRDDRCRILFENIKLERTDSAVVIQGMAINAVLMR